MLLPNWSGGLAESRPEDIDYTKHYVAGQRYWNRAGRFGWGLSTDEAFEMAKNMTPSPSKDEMEMYLLLTGWESSVSSFGDTYFRYSGHWPSHWMTLKNAFDYQKEVIDRGRPNKRTN